MFSSDKWFGAEASFFNSVATQSLRFDDGSASELSRTFVTPTNQNRWTLNVWVKLTTLGARRVIIGMPYLDSEECFLGFDSNDQLEWQHYSSGGVTEINDLTTTAVFRDTSSWYNIHAIFDSAGSGDDRQQLWVNGVKITSYGTELRSSNSSVWNKAKLHYFGNRNDVSSNYFDGYMSEINFVDGLALDPSYFGEFKNQIWIAKNPVVSSYGNNGFRLQFKQTGTGTASSSTIGADTSGNNNHFTSSGIVASDCNMPDSPENNFSTMNSIVKGYNNNMTMQEGNLALVPTNVGVSYTVALGNFLMSSGKWYFESACSNWNNYCMIGIARETVNISSSGTAYGQTGVIAYGTQGEVYNESSSSSGSYTDFLDQEVIGVAVDLDSSPRTVKFYNDNTLQATFNLSSNFDGLGVVPLVSIGPSLTVKMNFGADSSFSGTKTSGSNEAQDANGIGDFYYAPPSGHLALCSANLPEPTIGPNSDTQSSDHFNTVLYTGTGSNRSVTGVGFQPDWLWIKSRSATGNHSLMDSSRSSGTVRLQSDQNAAEDQYGVGSLDADGFTLEGGVHNGSSVTNVAWNWKANGGTTSSNTDGSITSTVQANTTAGFSIVLYTGTGASNATIGHGLGAVPKQIWVKNRDAAYNWKVYHAENTSAPETDYLVLDTTDATVDSNTHWNDTVPTSTVFSIGSSNALIRSGDNFVAYCFAEIEGYSKFGKYIGNGSTDGTFVYTGFRPAFVIYKRTNSTGNWGMLDSTRSTFNVTDDWMASNLSNSETAESNRDADFLSNGFKLDGTNNDTNASGSTYIYMAFAENPFKYANAR